MREISTLYVNRFGSLADDEHIFGGWNCPDVHMKRMIAVDHSMIFPRSAAINTGSFYIKFTELKNEMK